MTYEVQELKETWRAVLCKRSYLNKVALPVPTSPHYFAYAPTVEEMETAGWLRRIDETQCVEVYQLTDPVLAQIRMAFQIRNEAVREPSIFRRIEQQDMFDVLDTLHIDVGVPRGVTSLHANPDVFTPQMFTLVINSPLTDMQRLELKTVIKITPREKHWYASALLNPAPNEYHLTFWPTP